MKYWEKFIDKIGIYKNSEGPTLIKITGMHVTEEGKLHFKGMRVERKYMVSVEMSKVKLCVLQVGMRISVRGITEQIIITNIYQYRGGDIYVRYGYIGTKDVGKIKLDDMIPIFQHYVEVWV